MNGFCGILGSNLDSISKDFLKKSINLAFTLKVDSVEHSSFFATATFLESSPIQGNRIYTDDNYIILFAGDLIGYKILPWKLIESGFKKSDFKWFSSLRGIFAFVFFDKKNKTVTIISDHRAQLPVYYGIIDDNFIFSTDISTFTTLKIIPKFNIKWLYEYLYFNYPIGETTFLKGVKRILPSTILSFNYKNNSFLENKYDELLRCSVNLLRGKEALKKCLSIFKTRVPKYYSNKTNYLVALTGGIDSRSLLALGSKSRKIATYTYGIPNCPDLLNATKLSKKLNLEHQKIFFDEKFTKELPKLIYETVRLSGGEQSILRSSLQYIYKELYKNNPEKSVIISGIYGDVFRGGGGVHTSISEEMHHFLKKGQIIIDNKKYNKILKSELNLFNKHILKTFEKIKDKYGVNKNGATELLFSSYELYPKYFGGEVAIASNYFTYRAPYFDIDVLKLAYETEYSTLSFSPNHIKDSRIQKNNYYKKYFMQTNVVCSNQQHRSTYFHGVPISLYANGNKITYRINRFFIRTYAYLTGKGKSKAPLADWDKWFLKDLNTEFENLLNVNSLITKFINIEYLLEAKKSNNIFALNKLVTVELILKLINNKWNIK